MADIHGGFMPLAFGGGEIARRAVVEAQGANKTRPSRHMGKMVLARGESLSAFAGAAFFVVLALVLAASGWWTLRVHHEARRDDESRRLDAVGTLLATSAEALLEKDETSLLRGLVLDTARRERLAGCQVLLRDGTIVADSDYKKNTTKALAGPWPDMPSRLADRAGWKAFPMAVRGRGPADLLLQGDESWALWGDAKAEFGIGAIGAGGLLLLLGAYRAVRLQMRGPGAVGESVVLAAQGEQSFGVLRVHDGWGTVATAWNKFASEHERLLMDLQITRESGGVDVTVDTKGDLGAIFQALSTGLILVDAQQRISRANGSAGILLQLQPEQMVGGEVRRVVPNSEVLGALESVLSGKTRQNVTVEVKGGEPSGSVLRYRIKPISREGAVSALIVIDDVTQQRVADQARNAFVAQATHELRTPLTNIRLYMDALADGGDEDAVARAKALNVVSQEARRLERIVADMLSVSEIEAGSMKLVRGDVRLDALFEELENDYRAQATDKEILLTFTLPPKFPAVEADRDKLSLALHNLIGNALKYTPLGGKVEVRVEETPGGLAIDVQDNGIGVKADEHERIFDRFYRAKDKRLAGITGSGLGLALAREIARLHGGDITIKSEIDKGSTFRLVVPINNTQEQGAMSKAA